MAAEPYVLPLPEDHTEQMKSAPPVVPPADIANEVGAVHRTAFDKLLRVVEDGKPQNAAPGPSAASATAAATAEVPTLAPRKPKFDRFDSFRAAGKTVLAVNAMARKEGEHRPNPNDLSAAQAMTRLTGVIFENDGEVPRAFRKMAISGVESIDKMRAQINPYKPLVEQIVYWENLKVALYFTTGIFWTWLLTKLGFGFGWVMVVLVMVGGAFRRNQKRLRRKICNEMSRQLAIKKVSLHFVSVFLNDDQGLTMPLQLETDSESVEWMNLFLTKFWLIFEPSLSEGIKTNVDLILEANKPGFLDDLRLTTFTLGSQAPRVESIRCYPSTSEDILMMDWELSFSPVDTEALVKSARESSEIRHSKIELTARVGKGVASIPLPVLVTDMEFRGKARIQLKFMTQFPHIKTVEFCLLEKPVIDFNVRPLKGMDLMDTPGLSNFINDTIDHYTSLYVVDPNKITIDLEQLLGSTTELDKPVGVLRVAVYEAKGLKNMELAGKSDPYARLYIGGKPVMRTKTISNSLNPVWDETHHIVITKSALAQVESKSDELTMEILDWNNLAKDKSMGVTPGLRLSRWIKLLEEGASKVEEEADLDPLTAEERDSLIHEWGSPFEDEQDVWKKLSLEHSQKGDVRLALKYYPVQDVAPTVSAAEFSAGILVITIHQAKELPCSKSASPDCSIEQDGMEIFRTPPKRKTNNPVWDSSYTVFVTDLEVAKFHFRIWNDGKALGACDIGPKEFIGKEATADWFKLFGGKDGAGRIRVTFRFTPVDLEGAGLDKSKLKRRQPVALLRLNVIEAKGLANVEMMGKSDPYTKLTLAGRAFGATHVKNNVLDPKWNEIFYAVCYSKKESLGLSVWDWNDFKKDRTLGKVEFLVSDLLKEGSRENSVENLEQLATVVDPVGLSEEAWAKQERDGLKIVRTGMAADVWAPIYIQKNADDLEDVAAAVAGPTKKAGFPKVMSIDGIASVARGSTTKEPRQKGFLHFEVDYFPVISEQIISPERALAMKKSRSANLVTALATEDLDEEAQLALEKKIEADRLVEEEQEVQLAKAAKERQAHIAQVIQTYPSGIVSLRIHELQGLQQVVNAYAELLLDDEPVWTTRTKRKSLRPSWDESIDKYISNIPKNRFTIRIRNQIEKDNHTPQDPVIGSWTGELVAELLGKSGAWVPLRGGDPAGDIGKLRLSVGFAPVIVEDDGGESSGGMGMLHVDILEAKDVEAVDSGGKHDLLCDTDQIECGPNGVRWITGASDPYCQLYMNGNKVHKTKVIKKSLNPVWNETVSLPVTSRLRSTLEVRVKDWNGFAKDVTLGTVHLQLARIPPNEVILKDCPLEGARGGTIKLRVLFDPQGIDSSSKASGTHTGSAGAAALGKALYKSGEHDASSRLAGEDGSTSKMGRAVLGRLAGTTVGLGKTAEELGRAATRSSGLTAQPTKKGPVLTVEDIARAQGIVVVTPPEGEDGAVTPDAAPTSPSFRSRQSSVTAPMLSGFVILTIVEGRDLKAVDHDSTSSDPYIKVQQIHHGKLKTVHRTAVIKKTTNPRWSAEICVLAVPPSQIRIAVVDKNTIKKDVPLGEIDVDFAEWFDTTSGTLPPAVDRWLPLGVGGTGEIHVKAQYRPPTGGSSPSSSGRSINQQVVGSSRDSTASTATGPPSQPAPPVPSSAASSLESSPNMSMHRSMSFVAGFRRSHKSRENIASIAGSDARKGVPEGTNIFNGE
ncbi:hypothetical protein HKX48_009472 [Thoreauomyces humboldtii]|nr:hypothetical protein HKX48_009472 [Thoreauomyces humboldtii]